MWSMCRARYCQRFNEGQLQEWLVWCASARQQHSIDCQDFIITITARLWSWSTAVTSSSQNRLPQPLHFWPEAPRLMSNEIVTQPSRFWRRRWGATPGGQSEKTIISHSVDASRRPVICSPPPSPIKHNKHSKTNIHLSCGTASPSGSQLGWKRPWHSMGLQKKTLNMNYRGT